MRDRCEQRNEGTGEFLGVWEEAWYARARVAAQARRYRGWLRQQGCSRDEAAEMAVRFLGGLSASRAHRATPQERLLIH